MVIVYDSLTGMGKKVALKLQRPIYDINDDFDSNEYVLLLTRSHNFGQVTEQATNFLQKHSDKVVGVAVSGNRNWGANYGAAGDKISKEYNIPLVTKYEGLGFKEDIDHIMQWIENTEKTLKEKV